MRWNNKQRFSIQRKRLKKEVELINAEYSAMLKDLVEQEQKAGEFVFYPAGEESPRLH